MQMVPALQLPAWYQWAKHEMGEHEKPGPLSNERILEYRLIAGINLKGDDGDVPWCKIFVNAAFNECGIPIRNSAMARDLENDPNFKRLMAPCIGCVVTFWRGNRHSGLGHIGFYDGETANYIYTLGGNEGDAVASAPMRKNGDTFGFYGYYWPVGVTIQQKLAPVFVQAGEPASRSVSVV